MSAAGTQHLGLWLTLVVGCCVTELSFEYLSPQIFYICCTAALPVFFFLFFPIVSSLWLPGITVFVQYQHLVLPLPNSLPPCWLTHYTPPALPPFRKKKSKYLSHQDVWCWCGKHPPHCQGFSLADQGVLSVVSPRGLGRESTEAGHPVQPPIELAKAPHNPYSKGQLD